MRALSLFSGIGCFDLALAAHGVETVAGCDHEPFVARTLQRPSGAKAAVSLRTAVEGHLQGLWPTPRAAESGPDYAIDDRERSGGDSLPTAVGRQERGPLNPGWVDWLMGLPVGYTDPEIPNGQLVLRGWDDEPGPRVARDVPLRRQRLTALGNALMWRVASVVVGKALQ